MRQKTDDIVKFLESIETDEIDRVTKALAKGVRVHGFEKAACAVETLRDRCTYAAVLGREFPMREPFQVDEDFLR